MKKYLLIILSIVLLQSVLFSQNIKIMTWNIFMVPPIVFKSCQTERAALIADYIKSVSADVVVLEETFMNSTRAIIQMQLEELYPFQSSVKKSRLLKMNSGVWIFSKYKIEKQDFITYKKKKGSDVFANKGATFIELSVNHKKLQIIGTHAQSLVRYKSTRAFQFQQIKKQMADKYFLDSVPQFVVGDLNCNYYDSIEYANMLKLLDVSPISYSCQKYSWNGKENDLAYKFSEHTLETLDYILLRNQHNTVAEFISTEIVKPYSDSCFCKKKFNYLSDHNPVVATITLK